MNCPRCERATLIEIDRNQVVIDRCEKCRGVWLDRGELEKLIARESSGDEDADRRRGRRDDDDDDDERNQRGRSRWWDIFD